MQFFVADKIAASDGGFRIKFHFAYILKGAKRPSTKEVIRIHAQ
jgi:hypothetical protein